MDSLQSQPVFVPHLESLLELGIFSCNVLKNNLVINLKIDISYLLSNTHFSPNVRISTIKVTLRLPDQDVCPPVLAIGLEVVGGPLLPRGVEVVESGGGGTDAIGLGAVSHRRSVICEF